jgi:hypothetical protein
MKLKAMLASRIFWAAFVGLLAVVLRAVAPDYALDAGALEQLLFVLAAYIFGEAVEGGGPVSGWREVLHSRKFWAALIGAAVVTLHAFFPGLALDEQQLTQLVYVFVTFIFGIGVADRMARDSQPSPSPSQGERSEPC